MTTEQKRFYNRLLRMIRQYHMLDEGDRVLVGVSGGIDSVVLLYALAHLHDRLGIRLAVAHLNHQFRGKEAERDAEFVRRLAERLQIPCYLESRDVPEFMRQKKLSPQDAARQMRYQFFNELAQQIPAQKIATAHNADDQAETVLLELLRGAGLHGLGGIRPVLNQHIIRPLLTTTRAQIEAFARAAELEYVFDSSNASRKYLRNAIRLDLLPLLQRQFNPAIVKRLTAYAQLFQEDAFFIDKIATARYHYICKNIEGEVKIDLDFFAKENITIQRELIYKAFEEVTGNRQGLETIHTRAVIELFTHNNPGKKLSLPGKVLAVRSYNWGYLRPESTLRPRSDVPPVRLQIPGTMYFDDFFIETTRPEARPPNVDPKNVTPQPNIWVQYFDDARIVPPLTVRYRRAGDSFHPMGLGGKKTLKKFFIDRKVPHDKRNSIPLIEDCHGLIWVVGYTIDERVKIAENTQKVLRCQVSRQTER